MRKSALPFLAFVIVAMSVSLGLSNAYALGHGRDAYRIPGTVPGCDVCHDFDNANSTYDGSGSNPNLRWIRQTIDYKGTHPVVFTSLNQLADGDSTYDGVCEVCHTTTAHHRNDGSDNTEHYDGQDDCILCHPHFLDDITSYFEIRFVGGQSHETHIASYEDPKGPGIEDCDVCHCPGDFTQFGETGSCQSLVDTDVCDECHSPGLPFDGVVLAKAKWTDGVYNPDGSTLKNEPGNENWCASCHDTGTSTVAGVDAPDVMGNNSTWGYNYTGHGKHVVACENCHDLAVTHTDGEPRTYSASLNNYQSGYRLATGMAVPRNGETNPEAFALCNPCHLYTDIIGPESLFRDVGSTQNYHDMHLNWWPTFTQYADSDFDGVGCSTGVNADSAMTCIICHNVHGPPNPAMIRHGELISTPGTSDKEPALDFHWYKGDGVTETTVVEESVFGSLICGASPNICLNNVCSGCHPEGELRWNRSPIGPQGITLDAVWTTDTSDVTQTELYPTQGFRCKTSFTLVGWGTGPYFVQVANSGVGNTPSMPGNDWVYYLAKQGTLYTGTYEISWQGNIPSDATVGSDAKLIIRIYVYDKQGGLLLDQDEMLWPFSIIAAPSP